VGRVERNGRNDAGAYWKGFGGPEGVFGTGFAVLFEPASFAALLPEVRTMVIFASPTSLETGDHRCGMDGVVAFLETRRRLLLMTRDVPLLAHTVSRARDDEPHGARKALKAA
jgi:hypothetical protein